MMSKDFPPWKTVYNHFSKWNKRGILNYEPSVDEDALLDAGAEDVVRYDDWQGECHDDSRKLAGRKRCPDCGWL